MDCIYAETSRESLDLLVELRIDFLRHVGRDFSEAHLDSLRDGTRKVLRAQIEEGTYTGFTGTVGAAVACAAGLFVYETPPILNPLPRRTGYIFNFYTKPEFRNRGYARGLMEFIQDYAGKNGIGSLQLRSTEAGEALYKKCGFEKIPNMMEWEVP
ncbi:GNAT family N-acetyltransferase [Breznakiella homolactica]|uniref:GNAT family N-acetyltransferase n=1 Tax=Breznakiella homolactica TaxID=2798577 RepID=A0A7T7XPT7_9SPIR|nr:GNAT family N-acetyltransferase [Breznakiella homolactica]QQO10271.1 GNAT family N-acetyltransferase [Breznakiella homolactica]